MRAWKREHDAFEARILRVGLEPGRQIIAAINALGESVRGAVCWHLITDESHTLSSIGEAMRPEQEDRERSLAHSLYVCCFLFDLQEIYPRLSDVEEPWKTIRQALEDVDKVFHSEVRKERGRDENDEYPCTAHERRQLAIARGWVSETRFFDSDDEDDARVAAHVRGGGR